MNRDKIKDMLVRHEGLRLHAYKCSEGYLTLGVGRNLDANGISEDEAMYILDNDIKRVQEELDRNWGSWRTFPEKARMVCIDMCFQLGISGFMGFRRTRALMEMGMWLEASEEMLDSLWARVQTPNRALYNSRQIALCQQKQQKTI
ncbi:MAG: lysozyme [Euryarchaeota archaeon]|nr:lysozyme [Euryarchaeota archaeon]